LFILKNQEIIENQKNNPAFTKLLKKQYKQIYAPLVLGFFLIVVFGIIESFLFPIAFVQVALIIKSYLYLFVSIFLLLVILPMTIDLVLRLLEKKKNEVIFLVWLTRHSKKFENLTGRYGIYGIMFFASIILLFWKDLGLKDFPYEFILYVIFIGMWIILIQMLNLTNVVKVESDKLNHLNQLKLKILFGEISAEKFSKTLMLTNITKLERESFFLFFNYCYYSLNKQLLDKLDPKDFHEFSG